MISQKCKNCGSAEIYFDTQSNENICVDCCEHQRAVRIGNMKREFSSRNLVFILIFWGGMCLYSYFHIGPIAAILTIIFGVAACRPIEKGGKWSWERYIEDE